MNLNSMGWSVRWQGQLETYGPERIVRIFEKHRGLLRGRNALGVSVNCLLPGRFLYESDSSRERPAVGDWCAISPLFEDETGSRCGTVLEVLPRDSALTRSVSEHEEQILAANVDIAFLVTSANLDFNLNRLQRYLVIAHHGGAKPVIVVSKTDLCLNLEKFRGALTDRFATVPFVFVSAIDGRGLEELASLLRPARTGVFLGSSGVGKSSLVNALAGTRHQATGGIRDGDDRGWHTTSAGRMFEIPGGGLIIDTAGLRSVGLVGDESDLMEAAPKVAGFSASCRFRDCSHEHEPGCAVRSALEAGALNSSDHQSYLRLKKELDFQSAKFDKAERLKKKKERRRISKAIRRHKEERGR